MKIATRALTLLYPSLPTRMIIGVLRFRVLLLAVLLGGLASSSARAQATDPVRAVAGLAPSSALPRVDVAFIPAYQRIMDGDAYLSQSSFALHTSLRLGSHASLSLLNRSVAVSGTDAAAVNTLSDTYVQASYGQSIGSASLIANLGANLPVGKQSLNEEEFRTSVLLSQSFYDFRVPVLGQGFNIAPGLTLAVPVSEAIVLGAGLAYQHRGRFTPSERLGSDYDPGDEVIVTGGVDVRLGTVSALSMDLTFTRYGDDAFGDGAAYGSGTSWSGTVQLLAMQDFNAWRVVAHYQRRARTELPFLTVAADPVRMVPDRGFVRASYNVRSDDRKSVGFHVQGRYFSEVSAVNALLDGDRRLLLDLEVEPVYEVADRLHLVSQFTLTLGSFTAVESSLGLRFMH